MFRKLRKFFKAQKINHQKSKYDVAFDNVAIPEVHTHKAGKATEPKQKHNLVNYDNVAIPEVHIRTKRKK